MFMDNSCFISFDLLCLLQFFYIELFILCHLFGGIPYIFLTLIGGPFFVANIFSRHLQGRLTAGQSSYDDEFASYTSFLSLLPRDV